MKTNTSILLNIDISCSPTLDVILEDTTCDKAANIIIKDTTGDKAANIIIAQANSRLSATVVLNRCVIGLMKVSVVFALVSLTNIASIIVKISLNKASGTVQCAYLKSYAKLSLPQVDKAPQT